MGSAAPRPPAPCSANRLPGKGSANAAKSCPRVPIPLLSHHTRSIYLLNSPASFGPSPPPYSLAENLAAVWPLRQRVRRSARRLRLWICKINQHPRKSRMKTQHQMAASADRLHRAGRREGRRAPASYAAWQQSPGLDIPSERMEKEPSGWESPCGQPPGSGAAGTRRERQSSRHPHAGAGISSSGWLQSPWEAPHTPVHGLHFELCCSALPQLPVTGHP